MLKRKINDKMIEWKARKNKVALLVKGARQVGKTTSIREFGKTNYESFIEINFERNPSYREAFTGDLTAREIIMKLSAMGLGPFIPHKTLIFFDEIQSCPNARTAIKFLVEDGMYDYIESGSLLGINYKDVSSFPVGFEEQLNMYPLDFEEFLWAKGVSTEVIENIKLCYLECRVVDEFIHKQMMKHFYEYLIVGGMPRVVSTFVENADIGQVQRVQKNIIDNYRDDISKYADKDKVKVKAVFDSIPEQLNAKNKRFVLAQLEEGASMRKYEESTLWLADAGIAYHCFNLKAIELPLAFNEKRSLFKLYMADTGLLCNMALNGDAFALLNGDLEINEGSIAENAVAVMLKKNGHDLYYYDKKSRCELDFVIKEKNKVTIIEVKSGKDYKKHTSLSAVNSERSQNIGRLIVISKNNVESENGILYIPFYMAMFI